MNLLKKLVTQDIEIQPKKAPSWMSISEEKTKEVKEPVKYIEIEEDDYWKYPELKIESKVTHILPKRLETAILRNKDFSNWFETVWMVLNLNSRWNLNEAIIPENLRQYVGAKSIGIDGNWKSKNGEVIWNLYN